MPFKAASVLLVVAVALVSFSAVSKADCEDPNLNKSTSKIKRYFIYNDKLLTFFEAWHQCRSYGLQLATVKDILKMPFKAASVLLVVAVALVLFSAESKAACGDPVLNKSTPKIKRYFIYIDKLHTFEAWHQCRLHGIRMLATVLRVPRMMRN
ncbi:hypothetical protein pipiens_014516 [Culex pipiens pipiens]|uniref:Uncharacterized protein n=1 Tax=Culex pipiens pipiens TaxID=38569 RepID=A0ABD1CUA2_CULPP